MDAKQLRYCRRIAPAETALGRNGKILRMTLGGFQAELGALDAIGIMDDTEAQLGFRPKLEPP
jgi:hypothetical protein